jgi:hypothetical protein
MKKIIFILAIFTLMLCCFLPKVNAELSSADKEFLLKQCQVLQEDIDVIPKLERATQAKISGWIAAKDCQKLAPFKESRSYYRQLLKLEPNEKLPKGPLGWDFVYLTDAEYLAYVDLLQSHPD